VLSIEIDSNNKTSDLVKGVWYIDSNGERHFQLAKIIVMAASGIGTPRILLNSKSMRFPNGLLNNNDLVGRNLMVHPLAYIEAVFDEDLGASKGPQGCCLLSQEFYETEINRGFLRGYTMQVLRGGHPVETAVKNFRSRILPFGKEHHQKFSKLFNHSMGIAVITEDLPELHNRVRLNPDSKDGRGMPGLIFEYKMSENTKKMMNHGIAKSKQVLLAAGGKITAAFGPVRNTGWHLMGTVKMGKDSQNSIVNSFGQSHAIENLFVVDSSIFVTSGAVNPVASAQALTLRCCEYIKNNLNNLIAIE
jgi:choline dehydrogenase-like flavoprotein